ncbi:putative 2-dehydropantoate 2-reductase [Halopseudomonas maritima]|uniref:putative 2-dehydropantoate 2-reductase n=1 Tax=Halopseudomonas maritima TaxID=2918528 RepID=UPI001EEBC279|nr:putative 2-dehydropantoate 2-reductase [Halopseudomonas maritima]UJJ31773.1 putative 2-dehydropantoate 2-reductase [Halopseudomonas maritima]
MSQSNLKIGIIGTGAIGGFYGAMLANGGNDVHFLLRSEYEVVKEKGITIDSLVNPTLHVHPVQAYKDAADMPKCDWIFVGAKSTAGNLGDIIAKAGKSDAKVVLLQNGLNNEDHLRPFLPDSMHLIGGLCYVCLFREGPGVVKHQSNGMIDLGYHSGPAATKDEQQALLEEGVALLTSGDIPTRLLPGVDEARWQKLIWNAPFNGISVVLNAGTQELVNNPASRKLITEMMEEVIAAARARGVGIPDGVIDYMFKGTEAMPDYHPSMYHDWLHKRPMELDALYGELLRLGAEAGCSLPKIEAMLDQLTFLQARYLTNE